TGFPVPEVEKRLEALAVEIKHLLLWQRDAPNISRDQEEIDRIAAGEAVWFPVTGPYLIDHHNRMMDCWLPVDALAIRVEGSANAPATTTPTTPPEEKSKKLRGILVEAQQLAHRELAAPYNQPASGKLLTLVMQAASSAHQAA